MTTHTPNAERDRQWIIDRDNAENHCSQSHEASFKRGFDACLASLKGKCEFDQQAAHDAAKKLANSEHPDLIAIIHAIAIEGARWQFDQMAARVALAEQASEHRYKWAMAQQARADKLISANEELQEHAEHFEKEARRVDAIAAKLQERAEAYNVYANEMRDKLTAAELECKQWAEEAKEQAVEFVNMRDKLAAAEARVKELESIIEDIKMRRHSND